MNDRAVMEIGIGEVMHARTRPSRHRFAYPIFCLRIPLHALEAIRKKNNWLFSLNRRGLLAFFERDHGDRQGDLRRWIAGVVNDAGLKLPDGEIWLQAMPRVLGYVFNPVSFWYLHDRDGHLRLILAEVNNTFGEHHQYLLCAEGNAPITASTSLICSKNFHVSPFCKVGGHYRFRYQGENGRHRMAIDYFDEVEEHHPLIVTSIDLQTSPATDSNLLKVFCQMPLLTLGVVVRIHVQALRLWIKKIPFYSKPAPPYHSLTRNQRNSGNEKQI
ncbi:DUF1365 domain-containing protein [uncultured Oxalicibacterium sp.]|uniref:DUF1365 domain-containing protein n=1 Tax=uncultured Oxalicibacterium sp. TaxID=1168540 RepID=UPI0025D1B5D3|nr:DUF1365 domain-containing protein [uncultured Oxalicibacterium sp.]